MKRVIMSVLVLAAISIPAAGYAAGEDTEMPPETETVWETEVSPEEIPETEPINTTEEENTDIPEETQGAEDFFVPETEGADQTEEAPAAEPEEPYDFSLDLQEEPAVEMPEETQKETKQEAPAEESLEFAESEEEKAQQQELDTARAESRNNTTGIAPAANSIWIETIAHPCKGHRLSAEKYERFRGLTDFTFFTAQESGSYSAYNAGDGMVVLGKYQFTDFGAQGNGTATALVAYMYANCGEETGDLYGALYQAFVVEKRESVAEWNACALNDTKNFMALQDQFAYEHYYARGEAAVEAAGISLKDRPWVVRGMCFSIFNALGPYDEYGSGAYAITTAGIKKKDSNAVFIEKICNNMVSLYADRYTWMAGRYGDGSDTALGVSDKDLALEILSGSLFKKKEPVTCSLWKITIKDDALNIAKKTGISVNAILVSAKNVREYTKETEKEELKLSKDYTISCKINKKHTKLTLTIRGKGRYKGQELKKKFTLNCFTE